MTDTMKTIIKSKRKADESRAVGEKVSNFLGEISKGELCTHECLLANCFIPLTYEVEDYGNGDFLLSVSYRDDSILAHQIEADIGVSEGVTKKPIVLNYTVIYEGGEKVEECVTYVPRMNSRTEMYQFELLFNRFKHIVMFLGYDSRITINGGFKLTAKNVDVVDCPRVSYENGDMVIKTYETAEDEDGIPMVNQYAVYADDEPDAEEKCKCPCESCDEDCEDDEE